MKEKLLQGISDCTRGEKGIEKSIICGDCC